MNKLAAKLHSLYVFLSGELVPLLQHWQVAQEEPVSNSMEGRVTVTLVHLHILSTVLNT
jgi:hypothetical protein